MKKNNKNNKRIRNNIIISLIFLFGLSVLLYPTFSDWYYRVESNQAITDFETEKAKLADEEIEQRIALAQAYNDSLKNEITEDPYDKERIDKGIAAYARMLELRDKIGHVEIPVINVKLPVYAGTSETVLQMGVGHLEGTSLPIGGNSTHCVITAHTGLPSAKLFTDLDDLKVGDKFYFHNLKEILAYQVDNISVIEPNDFSQLLISPGHDYLTLLTCTPYMVNSHRLLVRGHRIPYIAEAEERYIAENETSFMYRYLFYIALVVIIVLLLIIRYLRKKKKKAELEMRRMNEAEDMTNRKNDERE